MLWLLLPSLHYEISFSLRGNYLIIDLLTSNPRIFTKSTYCCVMRQLVISCHLFKVVSVFFHLLLKTSTLKYLLNTYLVPCTVSDAGSQLINEKDCPDRT